MLLSGLRDVLEVPTLWTLFNERVRVSSGYCSNLLFNGRTPMISREDVVHSFTFRGPEHPAPMNVRGGLPQQLEGVSLQKREGGMLRVHTFVPLQFDWLARMTSDPTSQVEDPNSLTVLQRIIEGQVRQHTLTMDLAAVQSVFFGHCYRGADHNILTPTAHATTGAITAPNGAAVDYDFNIPDESRGNLDGVISALWSTAGTDIELQLLGIKEKAARERRPIPDTIAFKATDWPKLRANTIFQTWAVNNQQMVDKVLAGEPVTGLWGWNWVALGSQYQVSAEDQSTLTNIWPDKRVLITSSQDNTITITNGVEPFLSGASEWIVGGELDTIRRYANELQFLVGDFMYAKVKTGTNAGLELHRGVNRGWDIQGATFFTPEVFA